jgi:hypothetical protein
MNLVGRLEGNGKLVAAGKEFGRVRYELEVCNPMAVPAQKFLAFVEQHRRPTFIGCKA